MGRRRSSSHHTFNPDNIQGEDEVEIVLEVKAPVSDVPACPICLDFCHVGNEVETFTNLHHLLVICSPLYPHLAIL